MDTCSMNPKTWEVARTLTTEYWIASSMKYDTTSVEIALSSSIDAVGVNVPTKVLSPALVGLLPTTGNIQAL